MKIRLFVSNILLICSYVCFAVNITISGQLQPFKNTTINYSQAPIGSRICLYQDVASLPLIVYVDITEESMQDGTLNTLSLLKPGKYKAVCEQNGTILSESDFSINELGLVEQAKRIALLTDIHVMAKQLIVSPGSAFYEAMDADRKMLDKSEEIFAAVVDTLIKEKIDLVLITGDLTKDGEYVSHVSVAQQLQKLKEAGMTPLVIPGNHDLLNPYAYSYDGDSKSSVKSISYEEFAELYKDFGYGENSLRDAASLTYMTEPIDGLVVIGIDATRADENTSSNRQDYGRIRQQTLDWIFSKADSVVKEGKQIIALQHHQLVQHYNDQASFIKSAAVENGDSIALEMVKHGIRLVMTGHMHISNNTVLYNEEKTDSLIEISTGATVSYPVPYRLMTINETCDKIDLQTRYIRAIASCDDLQTASKKHTSDRSDGYLKSLVRQQSGKLDSFEEKLKNKLGNIVGPTIAEKLVATLPKTASARADFVVEYFSEPFRQTLLLTSEANENRKLTDTISQMSISGLERVFNYMFENAQFSTLEQMQANVFKQVIATMMSQLRKGNTQALEMLLGSDDSEGAGGMVNMLNSMLEDCSYCGTQNENQTNDLFLTINLPTPKKDIDTSIENLDENGDFEGWWDVLGRYYSTKPQQSGIYLHSSKKVLIY